MLYTNNTKKWTVKFHYINRREEQGGQNESSRSKAKKRPIESNISNQRSYEMRSNNSIKLFEDNSSIDWKYRNNIVKPYNNNFYKVPVPSSLNAQLLFQGVHAFVIE